MRTIRHAGRRRRATVAALAVGVLAAAAATAVTAAPAAASGGSHGFHRVCAQARGHRAACDALVQNAPGVAAPTRNPPGYGARELENAYELTNGLGAGKTVAIVDAYDLPTAAADLAVYRSQYGLPACTTANGCFTKVNQTGGSTPPAVDTGWGQEIALDLDMVSAACPACKILLVEANSASITDLGTAVNTAVAKGAVAVSNSYGTPEFSGDTAYDSYWNHPGVAVTVSSGDSGYGVQYPAASQYVTAVGGTSLSLDDTGWSESAWVGAGSGCSAYSAKPAWQTDSGCTGRTVADVSAVADPNTGVAVYDSTANAGEVGWLVFGGTSVASPLIAGIYAVAGKPAAGTYPASYLYAHSGSYAHSANLFDVTTGSNGSCSPSYLCTAGIGYDGPTGLGTPNTAEAFASGSPPAPGTGDALYNSGFEDGVARWTETRGVVTPASAAEPAHAGDYIAWLGGHGVANTSVLAQNVTIPNAATTAKLTFFVHVDSAETSTTTAYDKLTVLINGVRLTTLSNLNKGAGYVSKSYDVTAWKGHGAVPLSFTAVEDDGQQTSFVLDDVRVTYS